nr:hypothetical protein [uncultured Flavobacterium sp.]
MENNDIETRDVLVLQSKVNVEAREAIHRRIRQIDKLLEVYKFERHCKYCNSNHGLDDFYLKKRVRNGIARIEYECKAKRKALNATSKQSSSEYQKGYHKAYKRKNRRKRSEVKSLIKQILSA